MTIDVPTRGDHLEGDPRPSKSVGRRTVLAGAAWTVPAVALAAAAPAHAASGLMLAFDKTSYPAVGCSTVTGITLTLMNGTSPAQSKGVTVTLPAGFAFLSGGTTVNGVTDANGVYVVPGISVPNASSTAAITAIAEGVTAVSTLRVQANSTAEEARLAQTANRTWPNTPPGSIAIGANYFLSPTNQLWFEGVKVEEEVVEAAGWLYAPNGTQYADYLLPGNGGMRRASGTAHENPYPSGLPTDARPIGQAYFLTADGDLYHYTSRVTGNVKSVVTWCGSDGHHADIELRTGVLLRATTYTIDRTFSPLPETARPIGADYFLSDDGDLFFRRDFVATQVTSAVGWFYNGGPLYADYTTESGEALRAWEKAPRDSVYIGTPAGARALGTMYYLTDVGQLYWNGKFAINGVDKAIAWSAGHQMTADVRTFSGLSLRLWDQTIDSQWSPMPENALSIGASYYYEAEKQELYYQGKLLVTGVTSAAGYHIRGAGDFCGYTTTAGESIRAFNANPREFVHQNVPEGAKAIGCFYFLLDKVLYHLNRGAVLHGVSAAVSWVNGVESADVQLESGTLVQMIDGAIAKTYSPMPASAAAVGADYFLNDKGELYWQGSLIATNVASAAGFYMHNWGHQVCDYVTRDGVGHRAGDARPADWTKAGIGYEIALSRGYFLAAGGALYWYDRPVLFSDGTPVTYDQITPWSDQLYMHADIHAKNGNHYRLIEQSVQYQYWRNSTAPSGVQAVGIYYFLTPTGDLYYCGADDNPVLVANGVVEAKGWYDATRTVACADYRDGGGVVRRADGGTPNVATYSGAPVQAELLGSGYFLTSAKVLWFGGTTVTTNPASLDAWNDSSSAGYHVTYRTSDARALRAKGADPAEQTWLAGGAPLNSKLVGSKYALAADGELWFAGTSVATGVKDAVGWSQQADSGRFFADYFDASGAGRVDLQNGVPLSSPYSNVPLTATLLGYGFQLAGSDLLYQGSTVAANVASGAAWIDGGYLPFCDYRTQDLGAYRLQETNGELKDWTQGRTPVGSEPRGADYFVSGDGVLSFEGQIVDTNATDVVGWNWGGDRYADYRVPNSSSTKRVQAKALDKTAFVYASPALGTEPVGAGYWLNGKTGQLWYANAIIVDDVEISDLVGEEVQMARGWVYGQPAVNYRERDGAARRREKNANPLVTTFVQGSTPLGSKPRSTDELWVGRAGVVGVRWRVVGRVELRASHPGRPLAPRSCRGRGHGQTAATGGGACVIVNSWVNAFCQGQASGRCSVIRRAERASRAGTWIRVRRIVAVVALASRPTRSAMIPAVRVRLNAITASTSQALFAVNTPEGRCASGPALRSAWTCSMIA